MRGDHPVLADDTLERDQVPVVLVAGGIRRHVDVAAEVVKHGPLRRRRQPSGRRFVEIEPLGDLRHVLVAASVDVDPQKLRAVQPLRPARQLVEAIDLLPIEQDRAHPRAPVKLSAERLRLRAAWSGLGIRGTTADAAGRVRRE